MKSACAALAAAAAIGIATTGASSSDDVLARSRAAYKSLRSYSDTGTIATESQSPGASAVTERHTFTTHYRAPRHFRLEFKGDSNAGADHVAIWSDGGELQSWWSATGVNERYPKGQDAAAFATTSFPTRGAAVLIPSILLELLALHSALTDIEEARVAGTEDVGGRRCHKLMANVQAHFGAARPTTIWVDAETLLVRKILEDTPQGSSAGTIERVTTTFDPQANPQLDDSRFRFTAPVKR